MLRIFEGVCSNGTVLFPSDWMADSNVVLLLNCDGNVQGETVY